MPSIFMQVDSGKLTIKGESQERQHPDWIVLQSATITSERSVPEGARAAQRTRGETELGDVDCAMQQNRASLKLMQSCASGLIFDKVTIDFCRSGPDAAKGMEIYWQIILTDALITSYEVSGSGEDVPEDTFKLNYSQIEMKYFISNTKGDLTQDSTFKWDKEKSELA
jgi:type VI secretion system secreted protein Hcp